MSSCKRAQGYKAGAQDTGLGTQAIADHISAVSQEYVHLKADDINVPDFERSSIPHITVLEVKEKLAGIKKQRKPLLQEMFKPTS